MTPKGYGYITIFVVTSLKIQLWLFQSELLKIMKSSDRV